MPDQPASSEMPEEIAPVEFRRQGNGATAELDMTPMVDVTFLLLIFFMVTAAFSLQKSLPVPSPEQQETSTESRTLEEIIDDDDYVIVRIHKDNTIFVNDIEVPSEQALLVKLRELREDSPGKGSGWKGPSSLLVLADGQARHEKVVMAVDAGGTVGMENVRLAPAADFDY